MSRFKCWMGTVQWWFLNARIGPWGAPNPRDWRHWLTFRPPIQAHTTRSRHQLTPLGSMKRFLREYLGRQMARTDAVLETATFVAPPPASAKRVPKVPANSARAMNHTSERRLRDCEEALRLAEAAYEGARADAEAYRDAVAALAEVDGGLPLSTTIGFLIRDGWLVPKNWASS